MDVSKHRPISQSANQANVRPLDYRKYHAAFTPHDRTEDDQYNDVKQWLALVKQYFPGQSTVSGRRDTAYVGTAYGRKVTLLLDYSSKKLVTKIDFGWSGTPTGISAKSNPAGPHKTTMDPSTPAFLELLSDFTKKLKEMGHVVSVGAATPKHQSIYDGGLSRQGFSPIPKESIPPNRQSDKDGRNLTYYQ